MHCVIRPDHGGHGPIGANNQGFTRDQQGRILSGAAQTASDFLPVSDYYWVFRPLALTARVIRLGGAAL
jgi:hypothetical protein